ncbi:RHS repeat-associated core domain-containing protein [Streptomyces hirsutus]|uniref:hypothetical protein n=1 Tax=Streptomyces hirsutus TaxID=35620 RepID=UPI0033D637DC
MNQETQEIAGADAQPDPSGQEINPYLYAAGDFVNNIDPSGLGWFTGTVRFIKPKTTWRPPGTSRTCRCASTPRPSPAPCAPGRRGSPHARIHSHPARVP